MEALRIEHRAHEGPLAALTLPARPQQHHDVAAAGEDAQADEGVAVVEALVAAQTLRQRLLHEAGPDLSGLGGVGEGGPAAAQRGQAVVHDHALSHLRLVVVERYGVPSVGAQRAGLHHSLHEVRKLSQGGQAADEPAVFEPALVQVAGIDAADHF
eukprot:CAMPEP_0179110932 /NCGR_PEP_ID=MMETSP0796-20121207/51794_1 /TAXON_ID=73915 /ORGANISM="Pyrodinium bahamense, Strain pbaha01" /LENGTH=155 /DNA_ID=CAMNT_0020809077 /DNA_START=168 /DNA_END=632 /DNA_ORIENTATION=-